MGTSNHSNKWSKTSATSLDSWSVQVVRTWPGTQSWIHNLGYTGQVHNHLISASLTEITVSLGCVGHWEGISMFSLFKWTQQAWTSCKVMHRVTWATTVSLILQEVAQEGPATLAEFPSHPKCLLAFLMVFLRPYLDFIYSMTLYHQSWFPKV